MVAQALEVSNRHGLLFLSLNSRPISRRHVNPRFAVRFLRLLVLAITHYSIKSNGKEIFAYDQKEENDHQGFSVGGDNDTPYTLTSLQITGTLDGRWLATLNSKK